MKIFRIILMIAVILSMAMTNSAQISTSAKLDEVEIGEIFPEYTFTDVNYYKDKVINIKDLRGQWVVLDFWSEWCGSCIKSFPKMNNLQKMFGPDVKIIMVGGFLNKSTSNLATTRKLFNKLYKAQSLNLTVAYDTILEKKLNVDRLPDIFIVDPNGVLRYRTGVINEKLLQGLMARKDMSITQNSIQTNERQANATSNKKRESEFTFSSKIKEISPYPLRSGTKFVNGQLEITSSLKNILKYAFFGKIYWGPWEKPKEFYYTHLLEPILEISDSSKFFNQFGQEIQYEYGFYYPEQVLANSRSDFSTNDAYLQKKIQIDLAFFFPYSVNVEKREMPCYNLVLTKNYKKSLKSKGDIPSHEEPHGQYQGVKIRNYPIDAAVDYIYSKAIGFDKSKPILNLTGIDYNIDIDLPGTTLDEMIRNLHKNGLDLVLSKTTMKCIVVKDKRGVL